MLGRNSGALIVGVVVALVVGSCSAGTNTGNANQLFVTYANAADSADLFKIVGDGFERDATAAGIKLKRFNNNLDGPTALAQASLMVQEKPDVIIEWNQVEGVGAALGKMFNDAGIPCIGMNIPVPGCAWFNLSNKQFGVDAGKIISDAAKDKGWNAQNTIVLIGQAAAAGEEVNDSPAYFYITVADNMPGMTKVTRSQITPSTTRIGDSGIQFDCKNNLEESYTAVKNILPAIPADKNILLWNPNDDCALGSWRAIKEAGRANTTLTGGVVATPPGLQELRTNPQWLCEGALFIEHWPKYVLAMAAAIKQGTKPPALTIAPQIMVTKATVDQFFEGTKAKTLPPLPPENQYLKGTGVLQKFKDIPIPGL